MFPGVAQDTFVQLLVYLYTDDLSGTVSYVKCLELLEVANRLCLQRLITFIEQRVVEQLSVKCGTDGDVVEHCLRLLEPCKVKQIIIPSNFLMHVLCWSLCYAMLVGVKLFIRKANFCL